MTHNHPNKLAARRVTLMTSVAILLAAPALWSPATAEDSCTAALVPETVERNILSVRDVTLAAAVTEEMYRTATKGLSANAVLYGIPIGAKYDEYQQNVQAARSTLNIHEYEGFTEHYKTSRLTPESVEAHLNCLTAGGGLAIAAQRIDQSSYTVRVRYSPVVDQRLPVTGEIPDSKNVTAESLRKMEAQFRRSTFETPVDLELLVDPIDRKEEAKVVFRIGSRSRLVRFPPLQQRSIKKAPFEGDRVVLQAGGGNNEWAVKEACVLPKRGKFIPSTAHIVEEANTHNETASLKFTTKTPEQICAMIKIHNDSLAYSSVYWAHIHATEVYAE